MSALLTKPPSNRPPANHRTTGRRWGSQGLGLGLCAAGTVVVAVAVGQVVLAGVHRRPETPWQVLAVETVGGGLLTVAGFAMIVSATPEEQDESRTEFTTDTPVPDHSCRVCDARNETASRFCRQCGMTLMG
jgi:hypothetical protein